MVKASVFNRTAKDTLRWSSTRGTITTILGTTSSTADAEVVKLNSIVDPGSELAEADTHEALGFAQYAAMYETYMVEEARVRVDYFLESESGTDDVGYLDGCVVGLALKDDNTVLAAVGHYEETKDSVWTTVGPEGHGRLNFRVKPNRFFGVPDKAARANDRLKAVMSAGGIPDDALYLHIFAHPLRWSSALGANENIRIQVEVTVEYDCVFMEPRVVPQSL